MATEQLWAEKASQGSQPRGQRWGSRICENLERSHDSSSLLHVHCTPHQECRSGPSTRTWMILTYTLIVTQSWTSTGRVRREKGEDLSEGRVAPGVDLNAGVVPGAKRARAWTHYMSVREMGRVASSPSRLSLSALANDSLSEAHAAWPFGPCIGILAHITFGTELVLRRLRSRYHRF